MLWNIRLEHLSVCLSVGQSIHPSIRPHSLWQNGWLDAYATWDGEWSQSRDGCIRWG